MIDLETKSFALDFELRALSDVVLYQKAERWVHGFCLKSTEEEHLKRYEYAASMVFGKKVLDMASGCGYGSKYLFETGYASNVLGVDLSFDSVKYANYKYGCNEVLFLCGNASTVKLNTHFDVIVSFETIEHLEDVNAYLEVVYKHLKNEGVFVVSTPLVKSTDNNPSNPYHRIEWSFSDFIDLVKDRFVVESLHLQSQKLVNYNYRKYHGLFNRIITFFGFNRRLFPERHVQFGRGLTKVDFNFDFNSIVKGYLILTLKKRLP